MSTRPLAVVHPHRDAPSDIAYRSNVEVSTCQWCRWSDNMESLQCFEPRWAASNRPFCYKVNPKGECPHYSPSLFTRFLRLVRLRAPAWREDRPSDH